MGRTDEITGAAWRLEAFRSHLMYDIASMHTELVRGGIVDRRVLMMLKRVNAVLNYIA